MSPTLADRDAARKQVKAFYLALRRNGATVARARALAAAHAVKLGASDPHGLAALAVLDVDPEEGD